MEVDAAELIAQTTSNDVFDLASTLTAELIHIAWQLNARPQPPVSEWPDTTRYLPFHVKQAAELLEQHAERMTNIP